MRLSRRSATSKASPERGRAKTSPQPLTLSRPRAIVRKCWGSGAAGSALEWHSRGRGLEPRLLHLIRPVGAIAYDGPYDLLLPASMTRARYDARYESASARLRPVSGGRGRPSVTAFGRQK